MLAVFFSSCPVKSANLTLWTGRATNQQPWSLRWWIITLTWYITTYFYGRKVMTYSNQPVLKLWQVSGWSILAWGAQVSETAAYYYKTWSWLYRSFPGKFCFSLVSSLELCAKSWGTFLQWNIFYRQCLQKIKKNKDYDRTAVGSLDLPLLQAIVFTLLLQYPLLFQLLPWCLQLHQFQPTFMKVQTF